MFSNTFIGLQVAVEMNDAKIIDTTKTLPIKERSIFQYRHY